MVFLSRRPNILFEPPDQAIQAAQFRQAQALEEAAQKIAARDSIRAAEGGALITTPDDGNVLEGTDPAATEEIQAAGAEEADAKEAGAEETKDEGKDEDKEEDDKKKKKQDDNWDFLR